MKKIAVEEHFVTQEYVDALHSLGSSSTSTRFNVLYDKLLNLDEGRLQAMAEAGVDVQVLSLFQPGVQAFDVSKGVALARKVFTVYDLALQ